MDSHPRSGNQEDESCDVQIEGTDIVHEGETASFCGKVSFIKSLRHLKWQKYQNDGYIDIDIHKEKYKGSKNDLENPNLEIHKVNAEDEVKYRLEVKTKSFTVYSNTITLKVFSVSETPRIRLISNRIKKTYNAGENIVIKVDIENPSSVLCTMWQRKTVDGSQAINIALPKFKGTKSTTEEHVLCINDCDESDMTNGPYFLLAVCSGDKKEEIHSDLIHLNIVKDHLLMSLSFEVLKEEETPIHERKVLYHGCVELKADVKGFPNVSGVVWMKDSKVLDLGKYEGSCCDSDLAFLRINMVTKNDEGIYVCKIRSQDVPMDNETSETMDEQTSDMVKIIVIGDVPKVTLNTSTQYEPVTYGSTMILEAQIESSPPPTDIQWKKDRNIIQPDGRKFFEVESDAYNPKLRVENVDFTDSGTYCIAITNALGSDKDLKEIKVRVNKLFISGPVVVSPSENIVFKTIIPKNSKVEHAKWMIRRNQCTTSTEIGFGKPGYSTSTLCGVVHTQSRSIPNVQENIGHYRLHLNNLKSNIIKVFAYDPETFSTEQEENCLRFFSLQDISRKALRIKFDKIVMPAEFNQKWKEFETNCKRNNKKYMLPDKTPSNSNDLDVSSLCAMIQFFLNKTSSAKRSEKDLKVKYKEIANDVERIRKHRNNLCHASSLEMETEEFNDAVIDLIEVIQRLSDANEDLATEIYNVLNNVFTKGKEMDRIMENFKVFRIEARQSEKQLRKFEGKNEDIPQWVQDHDEISFHHWYPSSVVMFEKNTVAFRRWEGKNGVCFMNRPLNRREEIFVHIISVSSKILKFGLTNRDPKKLNWSEEFADLSGIQYHEKAWPPEKKCYACFSLCGNSSLIVSFDDSERNQQVCEFKNVTGNNPLWLAFDICEIGDIFQISKKKTPTLQNLSQIYMSFWPWPF